MVYYGVIKNKDGSKGSFSISIRGLSKMLSNENFDSVTITGKEKVR